MAENKITINMDEKCIHCGKTGAVMRGDDPGLCLKCINKAMKIKIARRRSRKD